MTRDGGGKVEPARRQSNSQTSSRSATTTSGGTTVAAVSRVILRNLSARGGAFGVIASTGAAGVDDPVIGSVFIAGMFIGSKLSVASEVSRAACAAQFFVRRQRA